MPLTRLDAVLAAELDDLAARGTLKGEEAVVEAVLPATPDGARGCGCAARGSASSCA